MCVCVCPCCHFSPMKPGSPVKEAAQLPGWLCLRAVSGSSSFTSCPALNGAWSVSSWGGGVLCSDLLPIFYWIVYSVLRVAVRSDYKFSISDVLQTLCLRSRCVLILIKSNVLFSIYGSCVWCSLMKSLLNPRSQRLSPMFSYSSLFCIRMSSCPSTICLESHPFSVELTLPLLHACGSVSGLCLPCHWPTHICPYASAMLSQLREYAVLHTGEEPYRGVSHFSQTSCCCSQTLYQHHNMLLLCFNSQ